MLHSNHNTNMAAITGGRKNYLVIVDGLADKNAKLIEYLDVSWFCPIPRITGEIWDGTYFNHLYLYPIYPRSIISSGIIMIVVISGLGDVITLKRIKDILSPYIT